MSTTWLGLISTFFREERERAQGKRPPYSSQTIIFAAATTITSHPSLQPPTSKPSPGNGRPTNHNQSILNLKIPPNQPDLRFLCQEVSPILCLLGWMVSVQKGDWISYLWCSGRQT